MLSTVNPSSARISTRFRTPNGPPVSPSKAPTLDTSQPGCVRPKIRALMSRPMFRWNRRPGGRTQNPPFATAMTVTEPISESTLSRSDQWHAVSASFMGWTLDAFDFFVLVFLVDTLAAQFHVTASKIILTCTTTLAMRPVGAVIFGLLADRYGRRRLLMA